MDGDEPIPIPITDVFDLHSVPPRDVKPVVEEYLELARERGFRFVRIIHGRGIGATRNRSRHPGPHRFRGRFPRRSRRGRRLGRHDCDAAVGVTRYFGVS